MSKNRPPKVTEKSRKISFSLLDRKKLIDRGIKQAQKAKQKKATKTPVKNGSETTLKTK